MSSKHIRIGDHVFASKKLATEHIRAVLYSYQPGQTVSDEHAVFLADLLDHHPNRAAKIGVGVASFQVQRNVGSVGFWLTRTDGSRTDFSYISCLTPPSPVVEAKAGFRHEIREQIQEFRRRSFADGRSVRCPVTNDLVTSDRAHVDHDPTFDRLLVDFLSARFIDVSAVEVEPSRDGVTFTRLADRRLAEDWRAYHAHHARLRIVSIRANLSILRRRTPGGG